MSSKLPWVTDQIYSPHKGVFILINEGEKTNNIYDHLYNSTISCNKTKIEGKKSRNKYDNAAVDSAHVTIMTYRDPHTGIAPEHTHS